MIPATYEWWFEDVPSVSPTPVTGLGGSIVGKDIWLDLSSGEGADRIVTAAGDWLLCEGEVALRQSLIRRLLTDPGEWQTKPDYGVGARLYVKAKNTRAVRDELTNRITQQFQRDYRVERVMAVVIDMETPGLLRIKVQVKTRLQAARHNQLVVVATIS